jgi:hypothetical protein
MKSESYFVLLSEDGLFYTTHTEKMVHFVLSPILARTWDRIEDAQDFSNINFNGQYGIGKVTLTVERVV